MMRFAAALLMLLLPAAATAQAPARPTVVELFTSQGCNSCPPADAYLAELARQPGVLALELHVDYWDYIGWRDPFALRAFSERQRAYGRMLEQRYIYTPQMVIDGQTHAVGSNRAAVERAMARARARANVIAITLSNRRVRIEGPSEGPAAVWFVVYDTQHETEVPRGENRGRRLVNTNIVRRWERIGTYAGQPLEVEIGRVGDGQSAAILVQARDGIGPIIGARVIDR